jgi:hypothetical protein
VAVGEGWVSGMLDETEALASIPTSKEYRLPAKALPLLLFLCQGTATLLWLTEPLSAFW